MDGRYKHRSARTNPTGKNKLEAGRKGSILITKERIMSEEWFLLNLHSVAQAE
jgi:hypothetical protein